MTRRTSKTRATFAAAVAGVVTLLLTACGAIIDTTMTVDNDGSGTRAMTATLSAEDTEKLQGGSSAVDTSIRSRLPSELTYSGISPTDNGGIEATFTLTFSSTEDYKQKVEALLSDTPSHVGATEFIVSDYALVQGITLQESFSSGDLLDWLFTGLIEDGVVSSDEGTNEMYEDGTTYVDYGGEHINVMSGQLDYAAEQNHGFDNVSMATEITDQDHISRTITYSMDPSRFGTDETLLETFLDDATPEGARTVETDPGTWTMTFSGDATSIQKDTTIALGGVAATFSIDLAPMKGDPSQRVLWLNDMASCDAVCSDTASGIITDHVSAGEGYDPQTMDLDGDQGGPVGFTYSPKMTSVTSHTSVGFTGSVTNVTTFVVPNSSVEAVGDGFAQRYEPGKDVGTFTTSKGKNDTTFTVTIAGDSVDTFRTNYSTWNDQSDFTIIPIDSSLFLRHGEYDIDPGVDHLIEGHPLTDGVHVTVTLPFGTWKEQSGNPDDTTANSITGQAVTAAENAGAIHIRTSSPTIPGLIAAGVLAAAVAFGVIVLIRRRQSIAARIAAAHGRIDGAVTDYRTLIVDDTTGARPGRRGNLFALTTVPERHAHVGALALPTPTGTRRSRPPGALAVTPPPPGTGYPRGALAVPPGTPSPSRRPSLIRGSGSRDRGLFDLDHPDDRPTSFGG